SALLPADHFETDTLAVRTERWLANGAPVTVAEQDGQVIGFAIADRSRRVGEHPPVTERELYSLYVLGAHHGGGAGQALLAAARLSRAAVGRDGESAGAAVLRAQWFPGRCCLTCRRAARPRGGADGAQARVDLRASLAPVSSSLYDVSASLHTVTSSLHTVT